MSKHGVFQKIAKVAREDRVESEVARFLLNYQGDFHVLKIKDIQEFCHVSVATPTRLAKLIGYEGFNEMKYALVNEVENYMDQNTSFSIPDYFDLLVSSLLQTAKHLNELELKKIVSNIQSSKKVILFGVGGTQLVAIDFQCKLVRLGYNCTAFSDTHMQFSEAAQADENTVAIGLTYSGTTSEVNINLQKARKNGAITVCVTGNKKAFINKVDYIVEVDATDYPFRNVSLSSRMMLHAALDVIYYKLVEQNLQETKIQLEKTKYKGEFHSDY